MAVGAIPVYSSLLMPELEPIVAPNPDELLAGEIERHAYDARLRARRLASAGHQTGAQAFLEEADKLASLIRQLREGEPAVIRDLGPGGGKLKHDANRRVLRSV